MTARSAVAGAGRGGSRTPPQLAASPHPARHGRRPSARGTTATAKPQSPHRSRHTATTANSPPLIQGQMHCRTRGATEPDPRPAAAPPRPGCDSAHPAGSRTASTAGQRSENRGQGPVGTAPTYAGISAAAPRRRLPPRCSQQRRKTRPPPPQPMRLRRRRRQEVWRRQRGGTIRCGADNAVARRREHARREIEP